MATYTIQYGDTLSGIAAKTGQSIQQLMQMNPSVTDPNKIYAGRTLNVGGPAPAPAPAPTPTPQPQKQTISQVAQLSVPDFVEDPGSAQIGQQYKTQATTPIDENAIRASTRAAMQGQIDAINSAVADQIANFRNTTGKNNEGQAYALEAAGGRVGSATGEAQIQDVENTDDQEANTYQDEANAKISALLGQADTDAQTEIQNQRAAIQQGAQSYFQYLDSLSSSKQNQMTAFVKNMVAMGVDPTQLSDADLQKISSQYGYTKDEIVSMYNDVKTTQDQTTQTNALTNAKAQADIDKENADTNSFDLSQGQAHYIVDPKTGQVTQVANLPKTAVDGSDGSGSTTIDPTSPQYKVAQDLAYGGLTFAQFKSLYSYSRDINQKLGIYQLASQLNPQFNAADFEAGYEFYKDPQTRRQLSSADNAIANIQSIIDLSNAAARSGVPAVNKIELPAKYEIGDSSVANFDQAQQLLADEVSGVLGYGSGTDMKLKLGIDVIDGNLDPATFASNMEQLQTFLQKKKNSLLSQTSVYGDPSVGGQQNDPSQDMSASSTAPTTYKSTSGKVYILPN